MKFLLLVILTFSNVYSEKLKVGISGSVPFRISEEGKVSGISLEIWEKIAEQEGFEYTIQEFSSVNSLVDAVSKNSVDIGIGPISVTSKRIELVSFTQPYYSSTKAFLVKKKDVSILFFLQNFFGETFIYAIGALLSLLFLFGNLLFLAERK
ncbi:MAG: transporter substrate-binding domain-containing protein, partial [Leptospiraceae bacterium]|nr:transporter substrate-binding domain-containing protein [Leptospiraceae bacterium]